MSSDTGEDFVSVVAGFSRFASSSEPATIWAGTELSFAQIGERVIALAEALSGLELGQGARVGIWSGHGIGELVAVWAAWRAGVGYVPLDRKWPSARLSAVLSQAGLRAVIRPGGADTEGVGVPEFVLDAEGWVEGKWARRTLPGFPRAGDEAYVLFTSGSTGQPKGVVIDHGGVAALARRLAPLIEERGATERLRVSLNAALVFDASVQQLVQWSRGHCIVPIPEDVRQDPPAMVGFMRKHGVQVLDCTPTQLRPLLRHGLLDGSVVPRRILVGGEAIDQVLWEQLQSAPATRSINVYGLTECSVDSVAAVLDQMGSTPSLGRPLAGVRAYVVDNLGVPVDIGVAGELWLGGQGLATAYLGDPRRTAERFIPDPFGSQPGARLCRTGDLVRLRADGSLEYIGRIDRQVKIRGHRIELGDVEHALLSHPDVEQAAVVPHQSDNGTTHLIAYVTLRQSNDNARKEEETRTSQWRAIFGRETSPSQALDPAFDTSGWTSSYTGLPISAVEMAEWVDNTVKRILSYHPSRVLEIGCGTGLLLHQLAPKVQKYVGTDFSRPLVERLSTSDTAQALGKRMQVLQKAAHELDEFPPGEFDMVVVNSVAQYFPSSEYLADVIRETIRILPHGGVMFIGDVRNAALQPTFYSSLSLFRASDDRSVSRMRSDVKLMIRSEEELVVHPKFFGDLPLHHERVTDVHIEPRSGRYDNEMNKYRYDAIVLIGESRKKRTKQQWHGWSPAITPKEVENVLLGLNRYETCCIASVPNARLAHDLMAKVEIERADGNAKASQLRRKIRNVRSGHWSPDTAVELARAVDLKVRISWAAGHSDGSFDVAFASDDEALSALNWPEATLTSDEVLSNRPLHLAGIRRAIRNIRSTLLTILPSEACPTSIVPLDVFPMGPTGKLDRSALRDVAAVASLAPTLEEMSEDEAAIYQIVQDLFPASEFTLDDSFFNVGGDSLSALDLSEQIRITMAAEVDLKQIFDAETLRQLAAIVSLARKSAPNTSDQFIRITSEVEPVT